MIHEKEDTQLNNCFLESIAKRRSFYSIGKGIDVTNTRIQEIIEYSTKHTPSAFNSQSARVILLLNEQHQNLWDITKEALREIVPKGAFAKTAEKIDSFASGIGTVLFFEDMSVVEGLQKQFPTYKDNFPIWSMQSNGMLEFVIWTALEHEGLGASLQHYNPLIDREVKRQWDVPDAWKLIAQMPFGIPTAQPDEKEFNAIEDRVKVFQ